MKTNLFSSLLCAALLFLFTTNKAQTKLLHYWHFNNVASGVHLGTGKLNSDYTRSGVTTGYLRNVKLPAAVKDTGYWDNGTPGDTINQRPGFGGCCSGTNAYVRTRNPNDSMQFLWYIPTKNFKNIVIKYGSQSSSTGSGPGRQKYDYSLDSGVTFITTGLPRLFDSAGTAFGKITLDLSSITAVNNTNKLMLRIRVTAPNTGASGNTRYDNISVEGDSIVTNTGTTTTGIYQASANTKVYSIYPNPSHDVITISAAATGMNHVVITDVIGQVVFVSDLEDKAAIDISGLHSGVYFVRLSSADHKQGATLRFIKN